MADLTHGAAWMGGALIPIADAAIQVTDWGVAHSDICYDVVPVWQGAFFSSRRLCGAFHGVRHGSTL